MSSNITTLPAKSARETAIFVRGLGKSYTLSQNGSDHSTFVEAALHRLRHPLRRPRSETFWALQNVSFEVRQGEVIGVIGRNGAGKSTLLKLLSQITEPTCGQARLEGRVGSLLEVGTGFHPELTGRENIFLNGAILGMRRAEISQSFDAIVDFAGVEQFLDTPVKRYSSGMYVRLAFAVAAHLTTEILIVDEVLAVGDAEFQRKCLGKMQDVSRSGRTVLFVSHHMPSIAQLCSRAMFLEKGRLTYVGDVKGAIDRYTSSFAGQNRSTTSSSAEIARRGGTGELRITSVELAQEFFTCGEEKTIRFIIERFKPYGGKFFVSCHVVDARGTTILHLDSRMVEHWIDAQDRYEGELTIRTPWLKPGAYRLDFYVCGGGIMDRFEDAARMEVIPLLPYPSAGSDEATAHGVVFADYSYTDVQGRGTKSIVPADSTEGTDLLQKVGIQKRGGVV